MFFLYHRLIKLTSPNLNYIMICGAIVLVYSCIPIVAHTIVAHAFACNVRYKMIYPKLSIVYFRLEDWLLVGDTLFVLL